MQYWDEDKDPEITMGLRCNFPITCPFHGGKTIMGIHDAKVFKFFLDKEQLRPESHAIDVVMVCPECGYIEIYGVAVTDDHYWRVQKVVQNMAVQNRIDFFEERVEELKNAIA